MRRYEISSSIDDLEIDEYYEEKMREDRFDRDLFDDFEYQEIDLYY